MKFQHIDHEALENDYKNGMTFREMQSKYKASAKSISDWLNQLGVPRHGHKYETKHLDPKEIVSLYDQGNSCTDIANRFDTTSDTVRKHLRNAGCMFRPFGWHMLTDKNPTKGKGHTPEAIAKIKVANKRQFANPEARAKAAERTARQIAEGRTGTVRNKLEKRVAAILKAEGLDFIEQYRTGKYVWDFYIPASNMLVEAHGTFWHGDPRVWPKDKLYPVQLKKIERDKERAAWANAKGYSLRIVWELDT